LKNLTRYSTGRSPLPKEEIPGTRVHRKAKRPLGPGLKPSKDQRWRDAWRFIADAMSGHWRVLGISVGAALISSAAVAIIPDLLGKAVDDGLLGRHWSLFAVLAGVISALGLVQAIL